tara:strand:- start:1669 stop:1875 length:207 start_codon:yes stop_codon:yes gene_type:complete
MAKSDTNKDKLDTLVAENNERVQKVEELSQQIEQCKAAINQLKEEHDFTRGQITLLTEMTGGTTKEED